MTSFCHVLENFIAQNPGKITGVVSAITLVVVRVMPPPNVRWISRSTFKTFVYKFLHQGTHQEMANDPDYTDIINSPETRNPPLPPGTDHPQVEAIIPPTPPAGTIPNAQ